MSLHRIGAGGKTKPYYPPGSFMAAIVKHMIYAIDFAGNPSAEVASFLICGRCYRTGAGYFMPNYEERDGYLQAVCPNCHEPFMQRLEMGELDLGIQRDELSPADNDFRLFGETFDQVARRARISIDCDMGVD